MNSYLKDLLPEHLKYATEVSKEIVLILMCSGLPLETIALNSELTVSELNDIYNSGTINGETYE